MTQFYSYLWLRKDGSPYYAGKGCNQRAFRQGKHYQNPPKDKSRILIFPQLNEAEAFESEVALIALFGRKDLGTGCLRNLTNGGEGLAGHRHSEESKKKMRDAIVIQKANGRKYVVTPEHAAKISATATGRKRGSMPAWWKAKLKAAAKIRANSPEGKERQAKIQRGNKYCLGKKLTAEHRAHVSQGLTGLKASPETKAKMSIAHKSRYEREFLKTVAWG